MRTLYLTYLLISVAIYFDLKVAFVIPFSFQKTGMNYPTPGKFSGSRRPFHRRKVFTHGEQRQKKWAPQRIRIISDILHKNYMSNLPYMILDYPKHYPVFSMVFPWFSMQKNTHTHTHTLEKPQRARYKTSVRLIR